MDWLLKGMLRGLWLFRDHHRGVFLAAAGQLGDAVEGPWYAAGQRLRPTAPAVDQLAGGNRTAQLQSAVTGALRDHLPADRKWETDSLSQFARLMRDIRNCGVHSRLLTDGNIKIYFEEDKCGLLFLEAHRHLKRLAQITAQATGQPEPAHAGNPCQFGIAAGRSCWPLRGATAPAQARHFVGTCT